MLGTVVRCASAILTPIITLLIALVLIIGKAAGGIGTIAYVSNRDGGRNIYLMDLDTGFTKQLTFGLSAKMQPAFSHDGSMIAFAADEDGVSRLYVMHSNGTNSRPLRIPYPFNPSPEYPVTYGTHSPTFSLDGQWLAFVALTRNGLDVHTTRTNCIQADQWCKTQQITYSAYRDQYPSWSPDGRWLAIESNRDGTTSIYLMPTACLDQPETCEGCLQQLQPVRYSHMGAAWSPDSAAIAYASSANSFPDLGWDVLVHPLASATASQNNGAEGGAGVIVHHTHCGHPSWSPDGRYIVYEAWDEETHHWNLHLVEADCATSAATCPETVRRITDTPWDDRAAVFLP